MGEIIRKLLRWIIFIIIVVLLILLIIKLANKTGTAKKTKKVVDTSVQTIKKNTKDLKVTTKKKKKTTKTTTETNTTTEENNSIVTSTLEVDTPDTGTTSYLYILGVAILGSGTYYIYRNRKVND